jgi:hypothetical protein
MHINCEKEKKDINERFSKSEKDKIKINEKYIKLSQRLKDTSVSTENIRIKEY